MTMTIPLPPLQLKYNKKEKLILPEFDFPSNTLVYEGGGFKGVIFFKGLIDLFFKKKRVMRFIDSLNLEFLDLDEWKVSSNDSDWVVLKNFQSGIRIRILSFDGYQIEYKDSYNFKIQYYISKKEYLRLRKLINIKVESREMDKLYNKLFNEEFKTINEVKYLPEHQYGRARNQ